MQKYMKSSDFLRTLLTFRHQSVIIAVYHSLQEKAAQLAHIHKDK